MSSGRSDVARKSRKPPIVIRSGGQQNTGAAGFGPLAAFLSAWRQRQLVRRLVRRDIEVRFRGSALGKVWALLAPLLKLVLYTVAFGVVIQPQWQSTVSSPAQVALIYFAGLVAFDFFFDCISRAPTLMFENISYVKKIVFPLDLLGWVVLGSAGFRLFIGLVILFAFYVAVSGVPPLAVICIPILLVLLAMVAIGFVWLLSSVGVYLRDVNHVISLLMPVFMFLTPVFFPLSAAPRWAQLVLYFNPLTFVLEAIRGAIFKGAWPDPLGLGAYIVFAFLFVWFCYRVFEKLRPGFADVL